MVIVSVIIDFKLKKKGLLPGENGLDGHPEHALATSAGITVWVEERNVRAIADSSRQLALLYPHIPWRENKRARYEQEGEDEQQKQEYQWEYHEYAEIKTVETFSIVIQCYWFD